MSVEIRNASNFYSRFISDRYKGLYNQCLTNLSHGVFVTSYEMDPGDDYNEQFDRVSIAILVGCPELFYVGQEVTMDYKDGKMIISFPNNYPDGDYEEMSKELDNLIEEIVNEANQLDNDFDKIMFVNEYLCTHIAPEFELNEDNGNAYGALIKGRGRCEGYAEAGKLIFDKLGIESIVCVGEVPYNGSKIAHAWLAVKYNEEFYAFDVAWNGSMTIQGIPGVVYTFMNQEFISKEHDTKYDYSITHNDEYLFWKLHNGEAEYIYDLQNAEVMSYHNGYYSVHHFTDMKFDAYQQDYELPNIVRDELSPLSIAESFHFVYREDIDVLMVYYINF